MAVQPAAHLNPDVCFAVLHEWVRLSIAPSATFQQVKSGELARYVYNRLSGKNAASLKDLCYELGDQENVPREADSEEERSAKILQIWSNTLSLVVTDFDTEDEKYSTEVQSLDDEKQILLMDMVEPYLEKQDEENQNYQDEENGDNEMGIPIPPPKLQAQVVHTNTSTSTTAVADNTGRDNGREPEDLPDFATPVSDSHRMQVCGGAGVLDKEIKATGFFRDGTEDRKKQHGGGGVFNHAPFGDNQGAAGSCQDEVMSDRIGETNFAGPRTSPRSRTATSGYNKFLQQRDEFDAGPRMAAGGVLVGNQPSASSKSPRALVPSPHSTNLATAEGSGSATAREPAQQRASLKERDLQIQSLQAEVARLKKDTAGRTQAANLLMDAEFDGAIERQELARNLQSAKEKIKSLEDKYIALEKVNATQLEKLQDLDRLREVGEEAAASKRKVENLNAKVAELNAERAQFLTDRHRIKQLEVELQTLSQEYQKLQENEKIADTLREKNAHSQSTVARLEEQIRALEQKARDAAEAADQMKQINEETTGSVRMLQSSKEEELFAAEGRRREALAEQRARFEADIRKLEEKLKTVEKEHAEEVQRLEQSHVGERDALKDHLEKKESLILERKQALLDAENHHAQEIRRLQTEHLQACDRLRNDLGRDQSSSETRLREELEERHAKALKIAEDGFAADRSRLEKRIKALEENIEAVTADLQAERRNRAREVDELRNEGDKSEKELIATWQQRVDDANQRLENEQERMRQAEKNVEQKWNEQCMNLRNQYAQDLATNIAAARTEWVEKERSFKTEAQEIVAKAEAEYQRLKDENERTKGELTAQLTAALAEVEKVKQEQHNERDKLVLKHQRDAQDNRSKAEEVLKDLKERHQKELESQKKQLESELGNRQRVEVEKARDAENEKMQDLRKQHEIDVAELVETIQGLRTQLTEKDQRLVQAEKEHAETRNSLELQQSEASNSAFTTLRSKCDSLKEELSQKKDENAQLQLDNEEANLKLKCVMETSQKEKQQLLAEREDLASRLAHADEKVLQTEARCRLQREQAHAAKHGIQSMQVLDTLRGRQLAEAQSGATDWQEKYRTLHEAFKELSTAFEQDKAARERPAQLGDVAAINHDLLEENIRLKKEKKDVLVRHAAQLRSLGVAATTTPASGANTQLLEEPDDKTNPAAMDCDVAATGSAPEGTSSAAPRGRSTAASKNLPGSSGSSSSAGGTGSILKTNKVVALSSNTGGADLQEREINSHQYEFEQKDVPKVLEEKNSHNDMLGYPPRGLPVKRELGAHERTDSAEKRMKMTTGAHKEDGQGQCAQQ